MTFNQPCLYPSFSYFKFCQEEINSEFQFWNNQRNNDLFNIIDDDAATIISSEFGSENDVDSISTLIDEYENGKVPRKAPKRKITEDPENTEIQSKKPKFV